MTKLAKDKRNQLILVVAVTTMGVAGLWFGLISLQEQYLRDLANRKADVTGKLERIKQASYGIGGTAYFHDLGKFVADFENQYPYFRLVNLDIFPEVGSGSSDKEPRERLAFKMDIITLIRPGGF